jgi:predicted RNA polymerase sigma factor
MPEEAEEGDVELGARLEQTKHGVLGCLSGLAGGAGDLRLVTQDRLSCAIAGGQGRLSVRAGRLAEARSEFEAAARLTRNVREAAFLLARADACD